MGGISPETWIMKSLLCAKLKAKNCNQALCSKKRRKPSWLEKAEEEGGFRRMKL